MRKERPLIDVTSLFSAVEEQPRCSTASPPPAATNPFQAPDYEEDEAFLFEDVDGMAAGLHAGRPEAA
ncbi:hypothetical protein RCR19_39890 [Streptomyces sp. WAC07094]|uniref:hypothetical protein n=1 Tax=unclassified Streptomyces TaxID=2593676 RepID=UPI002EA67066|nr:hypothetical protein [Streptomyces sp. WAC07094]